VRLALISEDVIAARLEEILAQEKVEPGAGVARELARLARGSMRDALSLADQLLALSGTRPTVEDVRRIAGSGGAERVEELCALLEAGDRAGALAALPAVQGGEGELVAALLEHLRGALLASLAPAEAQLFEVDPGQRERLRARGQRLGPERLQAWLEELIAARERMGALPQHARLALELALIELCRGDVGLPIAALTERLEALEERLQRAGAGESPHSAPPERASPPRPGAQRPVPSAAQRPDPSAAPRTVPSAAQRPASSAPPAPAPARRSDAERAELAQRDPFTRSVAELFTGQIEDAQIGEAP
jgi:DNA polymerase-3 subunit gamma/tau